MIWKDCRGLGECWEENTQSQTKYVICKVKARMNECKRERAFYPVRSQGKGNPGIWRDLQPAVENEGNKDDGGEWYNYVYFLHAFQRSDLYI